MTQEEWADRTFYLENLPKPAKGQSYTLFTLRAFLETLFDSPINAVRLPPLYTSSGKGKEKEQSETSIDTSEIGGLYEHESTDKQEKRGRSNATTTHKHIYDLPRNGGLFKGFAFTVVRDIEKARQARDRWSWDTKGKRVQTEDDTVDMEDQDNSGSLTQVNEQSHHDEEDGEDQSATAQPMEDTQASTSLTGTIMMDGQKPEEASQKEAAKLTPEQLCQRSGLCIMPIEHFNTLRMEYLQYMQDITVLREKEANNDNYSSRKRRRSTSPKAFEAAERWERKPRSPSPEKWERKALSPERKPRPARRYDDAGSDEYPRGCVCFVKRIHPEARSGTLKALFQAILESEEVSPKDHLQHVDHKRNVDSVSS